ncbi:MAG TPA: DUF58 domain-containing protein [Acidimicrobiia bacterium]|nr:DUF58 domain-containing protein [Acidimicrobiia bacterium]
MLTTRGGSALGGAIALTVSWLALGEVELLAIGAALTIAVIAALLITVWNRPGVRVERRLAPHQVHEGDRATVELRLTNFRRLPIFNLTVTDGIKGLGTARFALGVLGGKERASASYRIVCRPRGVYMVGPAGLETHDPLGLAGSETTAGQVDQLVVYPSVEELTGFPLVWGRDPANMASRPEHSQRGGEDFYTLRSYREGDDLRRVHWPTSARLDELMIRQMETPWQSRALVLLDPRAMAFEDDDHFEKAVSGAASVVRHLAQGGFAGDLWAGGPTIEVNSYAAAMESLALVQRVPAIDLRAVATRLRTAGRGGLLVLVSGLPDADLLGVHRLLGSQHRSSILLCATSSENEVLSHFRQAGVKTVLAGPSDRWAVSWNQMLGRTWTSASVG